MMTQPDASYLDPATLSAVDSIDLRARMIVEGLVTGMHRSPHQGFNVEFAQHRQYAPGDDLRHLDWKVFAKTDKLYLKQFQKETNLDLVVLVDVSGSMAYTSGHSNKGQGNWRKYDHAATLAAVLTYLALQQQDRAGLALFSDTVRRTVRTSNTHGHWQSITEVLTQSVPELSDKDYKNSGVTERGTSLQRAFGHMLANLTRRSLMVVISDLFVDPEALEDGLAQARYRGHDLMVLQTLDPAELNFSFRSPTRFIGLEGEGDLGLDPPALRQAYLAAMQEHLRKVEKMTRRFGFDYLLLETSQSLKAPLSHFLAYRASAARKGK